MIPSKLKVVELRAELSARGLDTKGVKAALVERLEKALEQENSGVVNDAHAENAETDVNNEKDESTILDDTKEEESMETEDMPENLSQSPTKRDQSPIKQESPVKHESTLKHESPIKEPVISTPTPVIQEQKSPEKTQEAPEKPVEQTPESVQGHVSPVKPAEEHSSPEKPIQEPQKPTQEQSSPEKPIQEHLPSENLNQEHESTEKTDDKPQETDKSVPEEDVKPDVEKMEESINEEGGLNGSVKEGFEVKVEAEQMDIKEEKESKGRYESRSDRRDDRKRRRSRSSSPRREHSRSIKEEEPELKENEITLSWYDSDLNLSIDTTKFLEARPFSDDGFGYIWAGVRGTHGFTSGKICYQVRLKDNCNVSHLEDEPNPNVLRVGWSDFSTSLQLGEDPFSYGFGGTGKISENNKFNDYGKQFSVGDVVTAFLEFTETDFVISFAVNEEIFDEAYRVPIETIESKAKPWALAPHILTKNVKFEVNFGQEDSWADVKTEHVFISKIPIENAVAGPKRPEKRAECEMIMMCGLPGAGKTFWANKHKAENPEKNYNILGTNALIDRMKVMGLPRKANYHGRWDVLIEKCTKCLGRLMDIGSRRRRHYILDQTNVFPAAQRRKMRNFEGFIRKAVVVVPSEEEFQKRLELVQNEDKKDVPDSAVLEMKANFTLPDKSMFEEVIYTELEESEAKELLQKYSKEASEKGYEKRQHSGPPSKRFRPDYHHGPRQDYRRHGPPAGYRRGGMDRGPPPRGNWSRGGPDRWRDNRHSGGGFRQGDRGGGGGWRGMGMSGGRRDFDRPRSYDGRSNRGPNSQPRQGGNFRDNRDRGKPKPRGGPPSGGNNASGANNAQGQWNSQNQYSGQQSQPWNSSGQNWGPWSGYQQQQQFKGFSQGATGNFGAQQPAQQTQQQQQPQQGYPQNYSQGYTNWQQYGYPGYGQNWPANTQSKDGNPVGATWQNWYTQNAASANTSQPPAVKKEF